MMTTRREQGREREVVVMMTERERMRRQGKEGKEETRRPERERESRERGGEREREICFLHV